MILVIHLLKNRGGLVKPSKDIVKICQIIEKKFRFHYKSKKGIYSYLSFFIAPKIPQNCLLIEHSENPAEHRLINLKNYFVIFKNKN